MFKKGGCCQCCRNKCIGKAGKESFKNIKVPKEKIQELLEGLEPGEFPDNDRLYAIFDTFKLNINKGTFEDNAKFFRADPDKIIEMEEVKEDVEISEPMYYPQIPTFNTLSIFIK
jgi:hypothetical protein